MSYECVYYRKKCFAGVMLCSFLTKTEYINFSNNNKTCSNLFAIFTNLAYIGKKRMIHIRLFQKNKDKNNRNGREEKREGKGSRLAFIFTESLYERVYHLFNRALSTNQAWQSRVERRP